MDKTIIIAAIGLIGSMMAGFLSFKASSAANKATADANRINEKKVDAEAYVRSQGFYEKLLQEADRHLDRLRTQVEELSEQLTRVTQQLSKEQTMSDTLRGQVRQLQQKLNQMEGTLNSMQTGLTAMSPTHADEPDSVWPGTD
jgi:peptidoglycan hydrolase CwlO-like protein